LFTEYIVDIPGPKTASENKFQELQQQVLESYRRDATTHESGYTTDNPNYPYNQSVYNVTTQVNMSSKS
jgi:hypothetical protein